MTTIWFYNPFTYIAGARSLLVGWAIMLLTAFIAFFSHTLFNSTLGAQIGTMALPAGYLLAQLIAWGCPALLFFFAGKIFSTSAIRFIDIAGTIALARAPMIFVALINFAMPPRIDLHRISTDIIVVAFVSVVLSIWMVALMYNAFRVSCNIRGAKGTMVFITTLLIAEVISIILCNFLQINK
ncbi:MAG TPA: YIP1 family protein [Chitinophaga sp.]|uniref:YIP1 family protein n=1 Tax=Chitinophaga sp. TaxID=1869181 RepID=UPI002BAB5C4F|nr:YIP1 family protein [Chitinophaga sp.]HVI44004.1 YIP1 family protein [Chitinophaga sp.]